MLMLIKDMVIESIGTLTYLVGSRAKYTRCAFLFITGTALLTMSGSPNIRGLTIDTAADEPAVIDEWGTNDVRIFMQVNIWQ